MVQGIPNIKTPYESLSKVPIDKIPDIAGKVETPPATPQKPNIPKPPAPTGSGPGSGIGLSLNNKPQGDILIIGNGGFGTGNVIGGDNIIILGNGKKGKGRGLGIGNGNGNGLALGNSGILVLKDKNPDVILIKGKRDDDDEDDDHKHKHKHKNKDKHDHGINLVKLAKAFFKGRRGDDD